jgi:hypothetical protein
MGPEIQAGVNSAATVSANAERGAVYYPILPTLNGGR